MMQDSMIKTSESTPFWIRLLAASVAASVLSMLIRPLSLHWLHWVAYLPMIWALHPNTPKKNRWLSLAYGTVAVFCIFRWIAETIILFSNIPSVLCYGILGLFSVAFGLPYFLLWTSLHPIRRKVGTAWIVVFPAVLVLIEWASMWIILFPYNQGISQYEFPPIWQLASVTGVWGVSYLVLFVNCAFGEAIYRHREQRPLPIRWMIAAVLIPLGIGLWGLRRYERIEESLNEAPSYKIAQLQYGDTMSERLSRPFCEGFYEWVNSTKKIKEGSVDLVVWAEGAVPYAMNAPLPRQPPRIQGESCTTPQNPAEIVRKLAMDGDFDIMVGAGSIEPWPIQPGQTEFSQYNSMYYVTASGEALPRYDKMVPLPFGEYIPLSRFFPFIREWIRGPGNFQAGTEARVFTGTDARIAAPICYEAILPGICRKYPSPDLLVNTTNDGWFGDTAAPHQHAMLSAARSIELGIPMYRSAYSGISMLVEPHGKIVAETQPFETVERVVRVRLKRIPTVYAALSAYGLHDWFVWLCGIVLIGGLGLGPWYQKRRL